VTRRTLRASRCACARAPSEGEANAALCKLIAKSLHVPARDVTLAAGATSRVKRLMVSGDGEALIAALERLSG